MSRSGGGLRVVRLERDRQLLGYGEHPHIEVALQHADEDYLAGGRPYKKVYGGTEPHYSTGSNDPSSPLDAWVMQGCTVDAWATPEGIVVELVGSEDQTPPGEIIEHVLATGEAVEWADRGFRFCSSRAEGPDGGFGVRTMVLSSPPGAKERAWMYPVSKRGVGPTFQIALEAALVAPAIEVPFTDVTA